MSKGQITALCSDNFTLFDHFYLIFVNLTLVYSIFVYSTFFIRPLLFIRPLFIRPCYSVWNCILAKNKKIAKKDKKAFEANFHWNEHCSLFLSFFANNKKSDTFNSTDLLCDYYYCTKKN